MNPPTNQTNLFQTATLKEDKWNLWADRPPFADMHKCPLWNDFAPKWVSIEYCEGACRAIPKFEPKGCKFLHACPSYQYQKNGKSFGFEEFVHVLKERSQTNANNNNEEEA